MSALDPPEVLAPRPIRKAGYALVATILIWLPLLLALGAKPIPDRREYAIAPPEAGEETVVPFPVEEHGGNIRLHQAWLRTPTPAVLMTHVEVQLRFYHSDHAFTHLVEGELEVLGTPCRFEIVGETHVANGRPVRFVRSEQCGKGGSPTGELRLTMRLGGPGEMRMYTRPLPERFRAAGALYLSNADGTPGNWPVLTGMFVDELQSSPLRRADLLSYVWTTQTDARWVWIVTGATLLLMWAGVCCFPFHPVTLGVAQRARFAARAGVGAAAVALALAGVYGLITPPFQAADESQHFASFAALIGRASLVDQGKAWAATTHNARITRHQFERFRPQDVGNPESVVDGFATHATVARSSLTARLWQLGGRVLPLASAKRSFTIIRLLNATVFALAIGGSAAWLAAYAPVPYPQLLVYPLLLVPALPFFGMHFGESALVTSIAVAFAALTSLVVVDGVRFRGFGLLLGLFAAALVIGARNSLPMLPMVGTLLLLRLVGLAHRQQDATSAGLFWGGFAIGTSSYLIVITDPQRAALLDTLVNAATRVPGGGTLIALTMTAWFPFALSVIGYLAERGGARPIKWLASVVWRPLRAATVGVPAVLILLIVGSFAGSLYWNYPFVESIQGPGRASQRGYFIQVAATTVTAFRWTHPSMLLSSSFWTGFGWLDTMPPYQFISILMTLTAASLIGLMVFVMTRRDVRLFATLMIVAVGGIVTLLGYVYSSYSTLTNLHGRYLIGWNLIVVAVCWTWPAMAASRPAPVGRHWPSRVAWLLITAGLIHSYAARFVLQRYF